MKTFFSSMHPTIRYLSTLLFCLPLIGCKPKETKLSGQIFIVTRGAENIKLGLVGVELIERHNAEEFFQKKHEEINSEILGRERAYAEAKTNNDVAKAKYDEFFSIYSDCLEMKDRLEVLLRVFEPSKDQQLEIVQIKEKMNKIASAQQGILLSDTLDVVREKYAKAKNSLEVATIKATEPYPKVETYFADFAPLVIQKIFTDAEGKFSTSFRHDKAYTIFAEAEREYGGNREHYYWLINAPTNAGSTRVLLSNNNLVSEDPDGYLKIKPLPEIQSLQTP